MTALARAALAAACASIGAGATVGAIQAAVNESAFGFLREE